MGQASGEGRTENGASKREVDEGETSRHKSEQSPSSVRHWSDGTGRLHKRRDRGEAEGKAEGTRAGIGSGEYETARVFSFSSSSLSFSALISPSHWPSRPSAPSLLFSKACTWLHAVMLPKVANHLFHHTHRAVVAVQNQTGHTLRNVLQLQSSSGPTTAVTGWGSSVGSSGPSHSGPGPSKYHASGRLQSTHSVSLSFTHSSLMF